MCRSKCLNPGRLHHRKRAEVSAKRHFTQAVSENGYLQREFIQYYPSRARIGRVADNRYHERISDNEEFGWLMSDIDSYNKRAAETSVSLLESVGRKRMKEEEEKKAERKAKREASGPLLAEEGALVAPDPELGAVDDADAATDEDDEETSDEEEASEEEEPDADEKAPETQPVTTKAADEGRALEDLEKQPDAEERSGEPDLTID